MLSRFTSLALLVLSFIVLVVADPGNGNSNGNGNGKNGRVYSDEVDASDAALYVDRYEGPPTFYATRDVQRIKNVENEKREKTEKEEKERETLKNNNKELGVASVAAITNHGGPVMVGNINVYYVYYGTVTPLYKTLVENFTRGLDNSPWWLINARYTNTAKQNTSSRITLAKTYQFVGTVKTALKDSDIQGVILGAITSKNLPADPNGIYLLLTAANINAQSGFCTQYCGWHTYARSGGVDIKYGFVGNPAKCPSSCASQTTNSPNGDIGADGAVSIIAHELAESATDPLINAWYDAGGAENADKCAWTWGPNGTVLTSLPVAPNGSKYNVILGGRQWLIQRNWRLSSQDCGMAP